MTDREVYISLGSNLGDKRKYLQDALQKIGALEGVKVEKVSSFYETVPWGYTDQPNYYNLAVRLSCTLSPTDLLHELQEIELAGGRQRSFRYAPRTIDIDILLWEGFESENAELTVPHPRMKQRAFVLIPLSEIATDDFEKKYGFTPLSLVSTEDAEGVVKLS